MKAPMEKQDIKIKWGIFIFLLAVSLALRLYRLNMSFWMDELITVTEFVSKPWLKIITEVPYPNNHILYTLLAKLSMTVFGEHEWSARLPAMIMGAITPPAAYLIFRKRFSEFAAAGAGLFLALNFWSVWFSQDARGYSAYILFGLTSTYFYLEYLEKGGRRLAIYYALTATVCVWFYLYGFFIIAAQGLWAFAVIARKKKDWKRLLPIVVALVLGISLYLPGLGQIWHYSISQTRMAKMHGLSLIFLKDFLGLCSGLDDINLITLASIIALIGLLTAFKKWPGFFVIYLSASFGIVVFSGLEKLFIYSRFLSFFMPVFPIAFITLLIALLPKSLNRFESITSRISIILICLVIALILIANLARYYNKGKEGFRESAQYLAQNYSPDKVICYGIICKELGYYYKTPVTETDEKYKLTPEFIKGKAIISRKVDWTQRNLEVARRYCREEKVWPSAGYKENVLWLLSCP